MGSKDDFPLIDIMLPASSITHCGAERGPRRVSVRALTSDLGQCCAGGRGLPPPPLGYACPPT
eukprot:8472995-Alexandrium_andersonii.AAC.1